MAIAQYVVPAYVIHASQDQIVLSSAEDLAHVLLTSVCVMTAILESSVSQNVILTVLVMQLTATVHVMQTGAMRNVPEKVAQEPT
jgi:hypothetical protein